MSRHMSTLLILVLPAWAADLVIVDDVDRTFGRDLSRQPTVSG
ncbi:hypothetical protein [Gordonia sp. SID5947]|nr:hypothetical protein [Gordonia sp. SID5947]